MTQIRYAGLTRYQYRAVIRTGATGAIAPVDFGKEAQIALV